MTGPARQAFHGRPGAPGLALGVLRRVDRPGPTGRIRSGDPVALVDSAFAAVVADFDTLAAALRAEGRAGPADIAEASRLMAEDPDLRDAVLAGLGRGDPPDVAIDKAIGEYADVLAALPDPTLAARAADVRAIGRRLLAWLHEGQSAEDSAAAGSLVVVAREVTADDLLVVARGLAGAVSVDGGAAGHAAIVARALGVPLVLGVDPSLLESPDGSEVLVDGAAGLAVVAPEPAERAAATRELAAVRERRARLVADRGLAPVTRDGHRVGLLANVAVPEDAEAAVAAAAEGIGLLRTELPFLRALRWPTMAEHVSALGPVLAPLAGRPVTVRTLDFADDKLPPFLHRGESGRLGRGLPLMLGAGEAFAEQFRAILTAGAAVTLKIMIPMVSTVEELRACRALLAMAAADVGVDPPPLGVMIELPEAVAAADALAAEADFFSIGSNDLSATVLGLDRRHPALTPARAGAPLVLRAIATAADAARRAGIEVSVCGDAAADPEVVPLLIGVGIAALSVAPAALDEVRAQVRELRLTACQATARSLLRS